MNNILHTMFILRQQIRRLYTKYIRAESFRKALVYQKRYLLLLLGGFQDCEQDTLAMIASLGTPPSTLDRKERRPLARFRAAVTAVVAIERMKFLVTKWNRAANGKATTVGPSMRGAMGEGCSIITITITHNTNIVLNIIFSLCGYVGQFKWHQTIPSIPGYAFLFYSIQYVQTLKCDL